MTTMSQVDLIRSQNLAGRAQNTLQLQQELQSSLSFVNIGALSRPLIYNRTAAGCCWHAGWRAERSCAKIMKNNLL